MSAFWSEIFGNLGPVEIEIGPGTGHALLAAAARQPGTNFLGIEHSHSLADRLHRTVAAQQLPNVRILCADAACVVAHLIPRASVGAYHIYFPDPWWKRRHHRRRLFTVQFARELARTLIPGGAIHVATDVPAVFTLMRATLGATGCLTPIEAARPPRTLQTTFERKGLARGATIHEAVFVRLSDRPPTSAGVT